MQKTTVGFVRYWGALLVIGCCCLVQGALPLEDELKHTWAAFVGMGVVGYYFNIDPCHVVRMEK